MVIKIVFLLLLFLSGMAAPGAAALEMMLPQVYEENRDISGWLVSEKLDGVRGYWDGTALISKQGIPFHPPAVFLKNFPDFALEGEIWGGRGTFEQTVAVVKREEVNNGWLTLQFAVFDVPAAAGGTMQRLAKAREWFVKHPSGHAFVIPQKRVSNAAELKEELLRVEALGGEGLIVRNPDALYVSGRSAAILKVKSYQDMEAVVVGHLSGSGKNAGRLGALLVQLPNGIQFKIGSGFSDAERRSPPPIGATISFKYYGLYQSGIPKFASFLRVRQDLGL